MLEETATSDSEVFNFMEIWKTIKGLEDYKVSNLGNVIGLEIKTNFGCSYKTYPKRVIKPWLDKKGYYYIDISNKGKKVRFLLHRLVALHFIENTENKPQINHKDGNKSNNAVSNLEWCTAKENLKHARDTGLNNISGVNNYQTNLKKEDIYFIRNSKLKQKELAKIFNVEQTTISAIKTFKTFKNV